jgi:uncharacterized RDD family membrane protein YckC
MTCQHCQTRILNDDHRCPRCGRRVRDNNSASATFPVQSTATARAYDFEARQNPEPEARQVTPEPARAERAQQALFSNPNPARVISFESLTTASERQSIRARAAEIPRPDPLPQAKVELKRARKKISEKQQRLDFMGHEEVIAPPQSHIICDAPVAPAGLRVEAALIDCAIMLAPALLGLVFFWYQGGVFSFDKHNAPFWLAAFCTIPVLYKLLWTHAGRDTVGMSVAGLRLVDFDGNPPSRERRYQRFFGGFISFLAAGIGLVWSLVDEDSLTWHDHMSSTFPTFASLEK